MFFFYGKLKYYQFYVYLFFFLLGKQLIETYFDFRLYRLWKTRQHSKLLDYDDIL